VRPGAEPHGGDGEGGGGGGNGGHEGHGGHGYADAWRAEWIKARTLASTGWLLAATVAVGVGLSAAVCAVVRYQTGGGLDPARFALSGIQLAQALVAIWAVRAVSGEYRSGLIHTTLTAIPRRSAVLAAKTTVIATLTLAGGAIAVAGSLLIARAALAGPGFTATAGRLPLTAGPTLRAAFGSMLYLGLVSILAAGTALAVRDAAAATGIVLGLLYLFPLAAQLAGNAAWQRHLQQIGPTTAGLAIQATTNLSTLPIQPWAGLAVLTGWAAAALAAGGFALHRRDS
jgi:ABC-2 type transport system permease protein